MSEPVFYPRHVEHRLAEALEDSPVVLIHGPRQCGKTTLAQYAYAPTYLRVGGAHVTVGGGLLSLGVSRQHRDYAYISFDDAVVRDGARADPAGFVADLPERVILDEIQRVPELFAAIKIEADRRRVAGRFILTVPPMCCSSQTCPSPWLDACRSSGCIRWRSMSLRLDQSPLIRVRVLDSCMPCSRMASKFGRRRAWVGS